MVIGRIGSDSSSLKLDRIRSIYILFFSDFKLNLIRFVGYLISDRNNLIFFKIELDRIQIRMNQTNFSSRIELCHLYTFFFFCIY
jgi:hypothetical protein